MNKQSNKQKLLIEYLMSSVDTFAMCKSIVRSDYFDPEFRQAVSFMHEYYDKYNATPAPAVIYAETDVEFSTHQITRDQIQYCANEVEQFCRTKAMEQAIIKAGALVSQGKGAQIESLVKDAMMVSLNRDMGLDYFANPEKRLERLAATPQRTSTGWSDVDYLLNGGLARTEMLLFSANSGGGKSIALANLGINFAAQGLNVLYISLELSEDMVAQRLDTMYTGVPTVNWQSRYQDIVTGLNNIKEKRNQGQMRIKRMPVGTNANAIRAYLKEFELKNGYIPDLLIVDYLDIMGANGNVSADNISEKDKQSAEQLREIGFDYNMFIATASQQNRTAIEAKELNQSHIAGGLTKVNTVDVYISIILNAQMKAAGDVAFHFLKTRSSDGVGKQVQLKWNNARLLIQDADKHKGDPDDVPHFRKSVPPNSPKGPASVLDLFNN